MIFNNIHDTAGSTGYYSFNMGDNNWTHNNIMIDPNIIGANVRGAMQRFIENFNGKLLMDIRYKGIYSSKKFNFVLNYYDNSEFKDVDVIMEIPDGDFECSKVIVKEK